MSEKTSAIRNHLVAAVLEIGTVPTILGVTVLVVAIGFGLYFAAGGIGEWWNNRQQEQELKAARAEKVEALEAKRAAEQKVIDIQGNLVELDQKYSEVKTEYETVFNRYTELRTASALMQNAYVEARTKGLVLNGGKDLSIRYRNLNKLLNDIDNDGEFAEPPNPNQ